ncbi:MAG: hypothetical protein V1743_06180 [Nanoarchaeota archaeon]
MSFKLALYFDQRMKKGSHQIFVRLLNQVYKDAPHFGFRITAQTIALQEIEKKTNLTNSQKEKIILVQIPYTDRIQDLSSYALFTLQLTSSRMCLSLDENFVTQELFSRHSQDYYPLKKVIDLSKKAAVQLIPSQLLCGYFMDEPADAWIEYCQDPLYFSLELDRERKKGEKAYEISEQDTKQIESLKRIRKAIGKKRVLEIIMKHKDQADIFKSKSGGIGIIWKNYTKIRPEYVYPKYFIREEIRKKGMNLSRGKAEQNAQEMGMGNI